MKIIEIPTTEGNILINTDHIMIIEPSVFKNEEDVMITLSRTITWQGRLAGKILANIPYSEIKELLR